MVRSGRWKLESGCVNLVEAVRRGFEMSRSRVDSRDVAFVGFVLFYSSFVIEVWSMPHSLGFLRTNKQKVYKKGVSLATWAWLELEVLGQAAFQRTPHGDINEHIKYGMGPTALVREGWFTVATRPLCFLASHHSAGRACGEAWPHHSSWRPAKLS